MVKIILALLIYYTTCTWYKYPAFNSRCQTSVCGKKEDRERTRKGEKEGGREQTKKKERGYFLGILGNQEKEIFFHKTSKNTSIRQLKLLPNFVWHHLPTWHNTNDFKEVKASKCPLPNSVSKNITHLALVSLIWAN